MRILLLLACAVLFAPAPLLADSFKPSHHCSEPYVPYEFDSEWERDSFIDEVEDYKECISDFVEEQNDAVRNHQSAAEEAIEDWNRFAASLNI